VAVDHRVLKRTVFRKIHELHRRLGPPGGRPSPRLDEDDRVPGASSGAVARPVQRLNHRQRVLSQRETVAVSPKKYPRMCGFVELLHVRASFPCWDVARSAGEHHQS
jgi:hypothetical protein